MKRIIFFIVLGSFSFLGFAQDNHPVSWKFSSEKIAPLTYKLLFHASIQEPWHIYPQQSSGGGLGMPTQFLFDENPSVEFVGEMEEKGDVQDATVSHYTKGVTFIRTVKLKSDHQTTLAFTIKYMACNNEMCLPPSSKRFTLTLNDAGNGNDSGHNEHLSISQIKQDELSKFEDFSIPNMEGKMVYSKDLTSKSKYTFIDFWASWCAPCRKQARELVLIYENYHSKGLNVIGISLDTDATAWKKAMAADGYKWTNLSDLKGFESPISKRYGIVAIPRNFLIDGKGNIVARDIHGKDLEVKLASLFN